MQKLIETLRGFGIEIPEDKAGEIKKALSENYKNIGEHSKAISKLEADRDKWKEQAEAANETLKSFEGIDPKEIQNELTSWKQKAENLEKDYNAKLAARDFEEALKAELANVKFTSEAAKTAVMAELRNSGMTVRDGKIMGLSDVLNSIKAKDASAFVDEDAAMLEQNKAKFTAPMGKNSDNGGGLTRDQIMSIKDRSERRAAMAANMNLFQ